MTQGRYQAVSAQHARSAADKLQIPNEHDRGTEAMTNIPLGSPQSEIADSFEPPSHQDDEQEDTEATEQDRLVPSETDPARFGIFVRPTTIARQIFNGQGTDGVFSNMSAKPEVGEEKEEHPPV